MPLEPLPYNAKLYYKPADHSWMSASSAGDYFAQSTHDVSTFAIPPYKFAAVTNDVDGNATYIEFKDTGPSGTIVAAISCTYVNKFVTSIWQVI